MYIPKFNQKLTALDISDTPQVSMDKSFLLNDKWGCQFESLFGTSQITGAVLNEVALQCPSFG